MNPIIDPRDDNVEDDASSTNRRSLLSLAGSLLAESAPTASDAEGLDEFHRAVRLGNNGR
jgi:hypothetical protein